MGSCEWEVREGEIISPLLGEHKGERETKADEDSLRFESLRI